MQCLLTLMTARGSNPQGPRFKRRMFVSGPVLTSRKLTNYKAWDAFKLPAAKKNVQSLQMSASFRLLLLLMKPAGRPRKIFCASSSSTTEHLPDSSHAAAASGPCFSSCWVMYLKKQMPRPNSDVS